MCSYSIRVYWSSGRRRRRRSPQRAPRGRPERRPNGVLGGTWHAADGAWCLGDATLSKRLAESCNHNHPCVSNTS